MAFGASADPDIMYYNQAIKDPDHEQFQRSILREIQDHKMNQHWEVIPKQDMPQIPSRWRWCGTCIGKDE